MQGHQEPLECDKEGSCHYSGGKGVKGGSTHSNAHLNYAQFTPD